MEHAKDPITMHGVHRLLPEADDPITTGSIGKTQGVSTVKTPAMNATIKNAMKPRGRDLLDLLRKDVLLQFPDFGDGASRYAGTPRVCTTTLKKLFNIYTVYAS